MTRAHTHLALSFGFLLALHCGAQEPAPEPPPGTQPPAPVVRATPRLPSVPKSVPLQTGSTTAAQAKPPAPKPGAPKTSAPKATIAKPPIAPGFLPPGPFNRNVVFLDPAHGGVDSGSRISDSVLEKDVALQLAYKLRSLLSARGFTVVLTREADAAPTSTAPDASPATPLTFDARAGLGNHAHPVACLLLHATGSGKGVHLYSSELAPTAGEPFASPWLTAQAAWVSQSLRLQRQIGEALTRAQVPLVLSRASVRPVDSLTCPALVVELAPNGADPASLNDNEYQQRVASAIASTLLFWQSSAQPPPRLLPPNVAPPQATAPATSPASAASPASTPASNPPVNPGVQP